MKLLDIVFIQDHNDEGMMPVHDVLYNVEGVVMHGAGLDSVAEVAEYLIDWDTDTIDPSRTYDELQPADDAWVVRPLPMGQSLANGRTSEVYDFGGMDQVRVGDYVLAGVRRAFASVALYRVVE